MDKARHMNELPVGLLTVFSQETLGFRVQKIQVNLAMLNAHLRLTGLRLGLTRTG